ncbi:MAG: helix-turn-helix domain-containing protein, partial [Thermodesulfobacteriota bacterium]
MDLKVSVLRREAREFKSTNPRVMDRMLALIELAKRKESRGRIISLDYERVAGEFGISSRTLFRWKKRYEKSGVKGVLPKASRGRRATPIRGYIAKKITDWRDDYNWGAEVITAHLKYGYGIDIKKGRVYRFLKRKGLILSTRKYIKRKSHTKVVQVTDPGKHTQTDVKHLPHILRNEMKCYVYNFVDHASKWEFKRVYDSFGPSETRDFIERLLDAIPFSIERLQSDNGIEFTYKYVSLVDKPRLHALDKICDENNIRHVLIPPGEKELQGLV